LQNGHWTPGAHTIPEEEPKPWKNSTIYSRDVAPIK
jgi:hypothetical protein